MAEYKRIRIEREELFKQVWEQSMVQLAKVYGLSDVGLRKICKRLNVPTPPQGYWARKNRKGPPILPLTDGPTVHEITSIDKPDAIEPEYFDPRTKDLIVGERDKKNAIKVTERLRNPHPLVEKIRKQLESRGPDDFNRIHSHKSGCGIGACNGSISRALRIMDALVKSLEKRGFRVTSNEGKTEVVILDEPITFSIFESTKRYELVVTPEMRKKAPYRYYQRYGYNPSGVIELKIDTLTYGARSTFKDRKNKRVDDQLNDFIVCLIETSDRIRQREDERIREAEKWRRQRENQAARQHQADQEKANREGLDQSIGDWQKALKLREFISAVEQKHQPIPPSCELAGWIIWANRYANVLDPLLRSSFRRFRRTQG